MMEWFYADGNGAQQGPVTLDTMKDLIRAGKIGRATLVWEATWPDWKPASTVPILFSSPPPLPARPAAVPPPLPANRAVSSGGPVVPPHNIGSRHIASAKRRPGEVTFAAVVGIAMPAAIFLNLVLGIMSSNNDASEPPGLAVVLGLLALLVLVCTGFAQFVGGIAVLTGAGWSRVVLLAASILQLGLYLPLLLMATVTMHQRLDPFDLIYLAGSGFIIKTMLSAEGQAWFQSLPRQHR